MTSPFRYTKAKNNIFLVLNQVSEGCTILQQPITYEQAIILKKVCDDIQLDANSLYITNGLKCPGKSKSENWKSCCNNLTYEIAVHNPVSVIYLGKDTSKLKCERKFIMESLYTLLGGKTGINKLKNALSIIRKTYFV